MKYNKLTLIIRTVALFGIAGIFTLSACTDHSLSSETDQEQWKKPSEKSYIDGNPIIEITADDFYSGQTEHLKKVKHTLAQNGDVVLEALKRKAKSKLLAKNNIPEITLSELSESTTLKATSPSLKDLSGHVRLTSGGSNTEEYYLYITPHLPPANTSIGPVKATNIQQNETYLALDVDMFHAIDDENGEEIWPVTIPAQSMSDPEEQIEVMVHKDGSLEWPQDVMDKLKKNSSISQQNPELMYISGDAVSTDTRLIAPGGGGGGGGGSSSPSWTNDMPTMKIMDSPFLALKSIRLHERNETGGAAEIVMQIEQGGDNAEIDSRWDYAFDRKYGMYGKRDWLNGISFFDFVEGIFNPKDLFEQIFNRAITSMDGVFQGRNHRTTGFDHAIYEVPDIDEAGITYPFTNMRRWVSESTILNWGGTFPSAGNFEQVERYIETATTDYFPVTPLNGDQWRFILVEDDQNYTDYANRAEVGGTAYKNIRTFNMAEGQYHDEITKLESKNVGPGSSDDTVFRSGVKNITRNNVNNQLENGEIVARTGNFRYEFTKVNRSVLGEPKQ